MSDDLFIPPKSIAEWAVRLRSLATDLRQINADDFYDETSHSYHPSMRHFGKLLHSVSLDPSIDPDAESFGEFLRANPHTKRWLPSDTDELAGMETKEILFRVWSNNSGQRWVSSALVGALQSGSLAAALARVAEDAEHLPIVIR